MKTAMARGIFQGEKGITIPTYKEQAYSLIKEAILFQRIRSGELYSQEDICNELGISRTPVREALLELQREGYIQFNRGKGIKVVQITEDEAKSILEMRINNEMFGAKLAAARATAEQLGIIEERLHQMRADASCGDIIQMYKLDCAFHRAIMEASQNTWLLKSVENLRDHFLRFENKIAFDALATTREILQEHTAIYEAVAAHDGEKAEKAMKEHMVSAFRRTAWQYYKE